ncbi:MAG: hypothetical protein H0U13_16605 [Gemmatimonadaceae bacterium]|nr:hypothetical protein [Gemmatimonadaceae bacterium]
MNTDLNRGVRTFQRLLRLGWQDVSACAAAAAYDGILADWMQSNWEMIVEASLPPADQVRLEVYGDGADCNDRSSRVFLSESTATHRVVCVPRDNVVSADLLGNVPIAGDRKIILDEFVMMRDGWYYRDEPFDCILVEVADVERVIAAETVDFELDEFP